ncbi:DNA ligase [Burkholderia gladioli]|uniref:ATP-dependent DNA ligase n=1 Tax=Burkholderia gladioli TaxID=28095 RepID=UPI003B509A7C
MSYSGKQIFDVLEQVAATSKKNEKIAILTTHITDENLQAVLQAGLDPSITYGVTGVACDASIDATGADLDGDSWKIITALKDRKLTGHDARDAIAAELQRLDGASAQVFARILNKDFRAGFSESTINKVVPGLIPEFPYMRCSLPKAAKLETWDWADGVISQEKADGMFVTLDNLATGIVLRTRAGSRLDESKFRGLQAIAKRFVAPYTQLHGELLVLQDGGVLAREVGNGILNSILSGGDFEPNQNPMMVVWDQLPLGNAVPKGKYETPYKTRLDHLQQQLTRATELGASISLIDSRTVHSLEEAYAHYRELLALGKEGTIISSPAGIWKDGTSKEKVKLKLEVDVDLIATAIVPGKATTKNEGRAGSITMESACGKLKVDVTIKNESLRDVVDAHPGDFIGRVWAVRANSIMKPASNDDAFSLFLPRMVEAGFRTDKFAADTLEQIQEQFDAAVKAA